MILLIIMNVAYALLFPLSKVALNYSSPVFLTGFRMTLAGLIVLGYQYSFRRTYFTLPINYFKPLLFAAFMSIYLTNVLDFWGFQYMTATKSCFLYNLYPFASAVLSWIYFNERLSLKKLLGLALGFAGALPMIFTSAHVSNIPKFSGFFLLPELAIIAAIIASPFGWIFVQKLLCEHNYDSVMANGITMFMGGIMAVVHSLLIETWNPLPVTSMKGFLLSSLALMFLSNVIGNSLYVELLKKYSMTFLSFTAFSEPLLTAIFDWLFFGIKVPTAFYLSIMIVFIGLYLFYKQEFEPKP
jgi:drug/metabolite transporter (DMT)-like permease